MRPDVIEAVSKEQVIKHLMQLRATLAHALTQPNISVKRFNEIRDQMLPLDEQLRTLGIDPKVTPQMNPAYVRLTRHQRRQRQRASKFPAYEQRIREKLEVRDDDN